MSAEKFTTGIIVFFVVWFVIFVIYNLFRLKEDKQRSEELPPRGENKVVGIGVTMYFSGDARYINGKRIKTMDEWDEWGVIKGHTKNIADHLKDLERNMRNGKCANYDAAKSEWHSFYSRLRKLCIQHCLWHPLLDDKTIFKPTPSQIAAEEALFKRIERACADGIDAAYQQRSIQDEIYNYILSRKGRAVVRKNMVNHFCGTDAERKKEYRRICNDMVARGLLSESHDSKDQLTLRIKRQYSKGTPAKKQLQPSVYEQSRYEQIPQKMMYKVKHTVGMPENVDRDANKCEFVSLSNGTRYFTSLAECTCPAYSRDGKPCKHMIALAKYLGHL